MAIGIKSYFSVTTNSIKTYEKQKHIWGAINRMQRQT